MQNEKMKDEMTMEGKLIQSEQPGRKEYDDFVPRVDFINRTGIYISTSYYPAVYEKFQKSGQSADEFIHDYERVYTNCVETLPLEGVFKYETADTDISGADQNETEHHRTIWDILNSLDDSLDHKRAYAERMIAKYEQICAELRGVLDEAQDANIHEITE